MKKRKTTVTLSNAEDVPRNCNFCQVPNMGDNAEQLYEITIENVYTIAACKSCYHDYLAVLTANAPK